MAKGDFDRKSSVQQNPLGSVDKHGRGQRTSQEEGRDVSRRPWSGIGEQQALFRYLLDQIHDGIFILDPDSGTILDVNRSAYQRLGYVREDLIGAHISTITVNTGKNMSLRQLAEKDAQRTSGVYEEYHQHRNGRRIPMEISARLIELDLQSYIVAIARDITDRKQFEEELRQLTTEDALTGVFNRRFFDENLEQEWRRMMRAQRPISLLMVDVDHFKHYNDTYGHIGGDVCLRQIASEMKRQMRRAGDIVARYGGEEFCVILPDTNSETAMAVAENLREAVENLCLEHRGEIGESVVTVSIGVATLVPTATTKSLNLVASADKALYHAKAVGRNRVQLWSDLA